MVSCSLWICLEVSRDLISTVNSSNFCEQAGRLSLCECSGVIHRCGDGNGEKMIDLGSNML